jgi:5-methylcytosine-specific restriction endonuclease McrA
MSKKLSGRKVFANSGSFKKGEVRISGKNSHLWKGGITPLNMQIRSSSVYKEWRKSVFKRDNFTCQHCGRVGGPLHADHIKPFAYLIQQVKDIYGKIVYEQIEEYSELWEIKNGRTLCLECHKKTKSYLNRHYVSNLCQNPK